LTINKDLASMLGSSERTGAGRVSGAPRAEPDVSPPPCRAAIPACETRSAPPGAVAMGSPPRDAAEKPGRVPRLG